jgi:hypothetical protein
MMTRRQIVTLVVVLAAIWTPGFLTAASADTVDVANFSVILNGTTIFSDSFVAGLTLAGGSGTTLSSGQNFFNGTPASYSVQGTLVEAGNRGILNTDLFYYRHPSCPDTAVSSPRQPQLRHARDRPAVTHQPPVL